MLWIVFKIVKNWKKKIIIYKEVSKYFLKLIQIVKSGYSFPLD